MVRIRKIIFIAFTLLVVFGTFTAGAETGINDGETSVKAEVEKTPLTAQNSPDMDIMRGNSRENILFLEANGAPESPMKINLSLSENISDIVSLGQKTITLGPGTEKEFMIHYSVSVPENHDIGVQDGEIIFETYDPNTIGIMETEKESPAMEMDVNILPTVEEFMKKPEYVTDHDTEYVTNETAVKNIQEKYNKTEEKLNETREELEKTLEKLEERQEMLEGRLIAYYEKARQAEENSTKAEQLERQIENLEEEREELQEQRNQTANELEQLQQNTPAGQITASGSTLLTFIPVFLVGLLFGHKIIPGLKERFS